jgi:hypothetical protein
MFQATGWVLEELTEDGATDDLVLAYVRPQISTPPEKV